MAIMTRNKIIEKRMRILPIASLGRATNSRWKCSIVKVMNCYHNCIVVQTVHYKLRV